MRSAATAIVLLRCRAADGATIHGVQVEGAFVMGMGLQTQEEVVYDADTGALLSDGTWTYKIPTAACIPRRLNVTFLKVVVAPCRVCARFKEQLRCMARVELCTSMARPQ